MVGQLTRRPRGNSDGDNAEEEGCRRRSHRPFAEDLALQSCSSPKNGSARLHVDHLSATENACSPREHRAVGASGGWTGWWRSWVVFRSGKEPLAVRRQSVGRLGQLRLSLEQMNLGAVDHFFETLASLPQRRGGRGFPVGRDPRSPRRPPDEASAKGALSRSPRSDRFHVAPRRRGGGQAEDDAEGSGQADWESASDRR